MENNQLNPSEWINKYGDYLYNYAITRTQSQEIAKDLIQDTFLSALKAKKTFKGNSSERTWLIAILKRKIIDYYRNISKQKEDKTLSNKPFRDSGFFSGHWLDNKTPANWNIEKSIETEELLETLKYCLSLLPEKLKACFNLKNMEDVPNKEICKELEISESNLWVMLHRARLQLRECLEINWFRK